MENLYGVDLCIGPALKDGFYYDAYFGKMLEPLLLDTLGPSQRRTAAIWRPR